MFMYCQWSGDCDLKSTLRKDQLQENLTEDNPRFYEPYFDLQVCLLLLLMKLGAIRQQSSPERMRELVEKTAYCRTAGYLASDQTGGACASTLEQIPRIQTCFQTLPSLPYRGSTASGQLPPRSRIRAVSFIGPPSSRSPVQFLRNNKP